VAADDAIKAHFDETGDTGPKTGDMALPSGGSRLRTGRSGALASKKRLSLKVNRGEGRKERERQRAGRQAEKGKAGR
jgi:hypothetical protein